MAIMYPEKPHDCDPYSCEDIMFSCLEKLPDTYYVFHSFKIVNVVDDTIYESEKVWRSANCNRCKNIAFCDGCHNSEFLLASQRSGSCSYCLRTDDSVNCSNSYNVICSGKISNSFFIQDANSLHECMFCSHLSNKRYCIANMQFEKDEYFEIKKEVVRWIFEQ